MFIRRWQLNLMGKKKRPRTKNSEKSAKSEKSKKSDKPEKSTTVPADISETVAGIIQRVADKKWGPRSARANESRSH